MIIPLPMTSKQLSEFEKSQIVAYSDCGQSFCNIAKKLNRDNTLTDVFFKIY